MSRRALPDALAVLALALLWALYFWRILTPVAQDQLSLIEGDFSGQFVATFGYQVERFSQGEIPLWDPYQYGGFPFLADTQTAVFYPPRLLTEFITTAGGTPSPGELYTALQAEMAAHVLLGTLLMYAFVRRLTASEERRNASSSAFAGLIAALTFGYGGYLSGYPQLQLAILEAGIWLPLALLGVFQATRDVRPGRLCLVLAGVALGLSLLAGHPQTTLFALYVTLAFLGWRQWQHASGSWRRWLPSVIPAALVVGIVAGGLAAVQLLPGLEYLRLTSRGNLTFDDRGNGFPLADVAQVIWPGFMTLWSPLYFGIAGLVLAVIAVARRVGFSAFFAVTGLIALGLSFGAGTVIYDLAYVLVPGVGWFRGQERAAFVVAQCVAVLAGLGAHHLMSGGTVQRVVQRAIVRGSVGLLALCGLVAGVLFVLWTGDRAAYDAALRSAALALMLAALSVGVLNWLLRDPADPRWRVLLVALMVFDLFSVTMGAANWEPVPARDRLAEFADLVAVGAALLPGERVDGMRGLRDNYGSLYKVPDIRTISPLRLGSIERLFDDLPIERVWDLLAVRFVLTDWNELPVPSTITRSATDAYGAYNVQEVADPRGFARLTYGVTVVHNDAEARGLLHEPSYDTRQWVILDRDPGLDLPGEAPADPGQATVTLFEPERIAIEGDAVAPAVLTLALPDYPGWVAKLNGRDVPILRAYGGLSAIALHDAGAFTVTLRYRPRSFIIGGAISLITLLSVIVALGVSLLRRRRTARDSAEWNISLR